MHLRNYSKRAIDSRVSSVIYHIMYMFSQSYSTNSEFAACTEALKTEKPFGRKMRSKSLYPDLFKISESNA